MLLTVLAYGCRAGFHISYKRTQDLLKEKRADYVLKRIKSSGFDCVILDFKTVRGEVGVPFEHPLALKTKAYTFNITPLSEMAREKGLYVIGRITVFNDPLLFKVLKKGHEGFVFPGDSVVENYNRAVVRAVVPYVDEIQLDYVRWPDASVGVEIPERRRQLFRSLRRILEVIPDTLPTSADIFGRIPFRRRDWNDRIGQDIFTFSELFDILSPMAYPSHYWGKLLNPYQAPYHTLLNMQIFGFPKERIRVWLQAFGWRVPKSKGLAWYIRRQLEATYDAGVDLRMFWMPKVDTLLQVFKEWKEPKLKGELKPVADAYRWKDTTGFLTMVRRDYGTVVDYYLVRGDWPVRFWWVSSKEGDLSEYPIERMDVVEGDGLAFLYVQENWPWLDKPANVLILLYAGAWDVADRKRNHTALWFGPPPAKVELLSDGETYVFRVLDESGRVLARSRTFELW
ncbi:MAG: hypothetical protein GXO39_06130 [Thermotogae bacterium]|nr:hypothetical protein [Thermotogota bacterium]